MSVTDVSDSNFEEEVLKSKLPVIVDIWAPLVRPLQIILPDS